MVVMSHYVTEGPEDSIHVTNAVMGHLGQHHVHDRASFKRWSANIPAANIVRLNEARPCDCGLQVGETRDHNGHVWSRQAE